MISWIQRTFQQHFQAIFIVLLAGTIISFIFTIGNFGPGIGGGGQKALSRPFFNHNLGNEADKQQIGTDASLSLYLQGANGLDGTQFQQYALGRIAALATADQLGLPRPDTAQIEDFVKGLPLFAGQDGRFDVQRYNAFRANLKSNPSVREADVSRVIAEDYRIQQVEKLLGGPGYALPIDVRTFLTSADSQWTIAVATADYAAFKPVIPVNDVGLQKFYADNIFRYEVPPRVSLDYVEFPASAYAGQVKITDAEVRAFYDANPGRFPKPAAATGAQKPDLKISDAKAASPDADFAAVRPQVEAALRLAKAAHLAGEDASNFAVAIYNGKYTAETSPGFAAFVASHNLQLKSAPPFTQDAPPAALGWGPDIADQAFRLGTDRFFSDALPTGTGSVVLLWKATLPSYKPQLAEVRDRAVADYQETERRKRFIELGATIRSLIETHLKAGDTFEKAVTDITTSTPAKLTVKSYAPFTLRQPPQDIPYPALGALQHLAPGQVSAMVATADAGYLVYAAQKKTPDLTPANPDYKVAEARIEQSTSGLTAALGLNEIVDRELAKSGPAPAE